MKTARFFNKNNKNQINIININFLFTSFTNCENKLMCVNVYFINSWLLTAYNKFAANKIFVFYSDDKDQKKSQKVLAELENIDDECDQNDIAFVKIDNDAEAKEYGIDNLPALIFFEKRIPFVYEGKIF